MADGNPTDAAGSAGDEVATSKSRLRKENGPDSDTKEKPMKRARCGSPSIQTDVAPVVIPKPVPTMTDQLRDPVPDPRRSMADQLTHRIQNFPLLPRDAKVLLLDIEGGVTSLSYVKNYMAQFVLDNLDSHLDGLSPEKIAELAKSLEADVMTLDVDHAARLEYCRSMLPLVADDELGSDRVEEVAKELARVMVKHEVKLPAIASLSGAIWREGRESGRLEGHIYPDFIPLIKRCKALGVSVCIFALTPAREQKALFKMSSQGNLSPYISAHFDTRTIGPKTDPKSYVKITKSLGVAPEDVAFLSIDEVELKAAKEAGVGFAVKRVRPANWSVPLAGDEEFPVVYSMLKLLGLSHR